MNNDDSGDARLSAAATQMMVRALVGYLSAEKVGAAAHLIEQLNRAIVERTAEEEAAWREALRSRAMVLFFAA